MAYQAFYRKYRPATFSDVVGQEHITDILKKEVAENKTVHAYLFTGTRGTGKTSCAKILAKAVNCLSNSEGDPCLECEMCRLAAEDKNTDIVEIDAASNNSVESIRELRDMVGFTPSVSKYRVYIIDEVHMLSTSAFNALLKTLEEPPAHVIFILATTEVHKLPATILSRCQRFDFRRIESEKICQRLKYVASNEGITLTDDAATLIASAADGGMRDALSIFDLCASGSSNIDEETVESVCAMAGNDYLIKLADAIRSCDCETALTLVDSLHNSSVDMVRLLTELTAHFRDLMIVKTVKSEKKPIVCSAKRLEALKNQADKFNISEIVSTIETLQNAFPSMQTRNTRAAMEMVLIKLCNPSVSSDFSALEKRISMLEKKLDNISYGQSESKTFTPVQEERVAVKEESTFESDELPPPFDDSDAPSDMQRTVDSTAKNNSQDTVFVDRWDEIISIIKRDCPLLGGVLVGSNAYIRGKYLLIDAKSSQFKSLINSGNPLYKDTIRQAAFSVLGEKYNLGPYTEAVSKSEKDPLDDFAARLKMLEIN